MNTCENRHVCFKDLEDYLRKDSYLSGYSKSEQEEIRKNLGVIGKSDIEEIVKYYLETYTILTYDQLRELIEHKELASGRIYVISDFQTIYLSNTGTTWGFADHESKKYKIIVQALTESILDSNVKIISDDFPRSLLWEAKYDSTQEIINAVPTKGKITYLKDEYNNSAYYDFKNIQFRISQSELSSVGIETTYPYKDYYTFNSSAKNVTISEFSDQNVFLKSAENVTIESGANNNLCNSSIKNTYISKGVCNSFIRHSLFQKDVQKTIISSNDIPLVTYFDPDTLTQQTYEIDNIH